MVYTKIEYHENGLIKSIEIRSWHLTFSGDLKDLQQIKEKEP
jgi:hypothetical protein